MTGFDLSGGTMAGTFSQIYIQIVFAVQGRQNLLQKEWREQRSKDRIWSLALLVANRDRSLGS